MSFQVRLEVSKLNAVVRATGLFLLILILILGAVLIGFALPDEETKSQEVRLLSMPYTSFVPMAGKVPRGIMFVWNEEKFRALSLKADEGNMWLYGGADGDIDYMIAINGVRFRHIQESPVASTWRSEDILQIEGQNTLSSRGVNSKPEPQNPPDSLESRF